MRTDSTAETVLAEAQAQVAGETAGETAAETAPETEAAEVAVEAAPDPGELPEDTEPAGEETGRRSLSWGDALKRVPPDIAKLMKQMQGDYTRKTQELADQRRDFKRERSALLQGRKSLKAPEEVPEYDPFNESTVQARIEAEVIRRLNEVMEPMEREYLTMQAEDAYQGFLTEHPEFETDTAMRSAVQELLEQNDHLDLETAFWAVKGRRTKQAAKQESQGRRARRAAERQAALTGTATARRAPPASRPGKRDLKNMSAGDLYRLAQDMHKNR